MTVFCAGVPWNCALDVFTIGCVAAELHLGKLLFPQGIESSREHLALVERIVCPFPMDFATRYESGHPGTFRIDGTVTVVFPPGNAVLEKEKHGPAMRRIQCALPLAVSITHFPCPVECI